MPTSPRILNWGILGTGSIAQTFAQALGQARTGKLVAVASRTEKTARSFADQHGRIKAYGSYEKLLADQDISAVYISTPHPFHAEWCLRAAEAGKNILCEKPLTMNYPQAVEVVSAVRRSGVFLMEAFMYRCHPQTAKLLEIIRSGAIGRIGVIQATFSYPGVFRKESRVFHPDLGGGGILDVGCYPVSISRLLAGAAQGLPFANPLEVSGHAVLHPETGIDLYAVATARFSGDILAQWACGVALRQEPGLRVFGSTGWLHVPEPFIVAREGGPSTIFLMNLDNTLQEKITLQTDRSLYALEADTVGEAVARNERESVMMSLDDTLGNMAALDAWRSAVGVSYGKEKGPG